MSIEMRSRPRLRRAEDYAHELVRRNGAVTAFDIAKENSGAYFRDKHGEPTGKNPHGPYFNHVKNIIKKEYWEELERETVEHSRRRANRAKLDKNEGEAV